MDDSYTDQKRRKFIASSLGCLATAGLASLSNPIEIFAQSTTNKSKTTSNEIMYRTLGRTGIKVPVVSMGAGACNDPGLVSACWEAGMRHFDTAANYGYGRNEQMVAKAINKLGVRQDAIIGTKVHTPAQRRGLTPEQSKKRLLDSLDASLKRLKTDYVDILYVHDVRNQDTVNDQAIMEAMSQVKKEGKTRFIGISTHAEMASVINATVKAKIYDVVLTSINFTMKDDIALIKAIANAAANKIGVIGMKTQAGGARFPNPASLKDYDGSVINSAALKWALNNKAIATTIPGISTFDHMRSNMNVSKDIEFTDIEKKFLSDNNVKFGMGFCRQCSLCLTTCPKDADIPTLMRTHMYAAQYSDFQKARLTLNQIPGNNNLNSNCTLCDNCVAACSNAVNIPQKISELKLMYV